MTQMIKGMSMSEDSGTVLFEFDGDFDCVSSAPGGGFMKGITRISFGDYEDCDLAIPCPDPAAVRTAYGAFGETDVFAAAYSDLRDGLSRAAEPSSAAAGMTHVLVVLGCGTPESGMLRTTVTATEAVTSVIQDLMLRSDGGSASASGSVRQTVTVVRSNGSPLFLHGAGKHSKLGQLIGTAVRSAVRESAAANGVSEEGLCDAMVIMERYGYDSEKMFRMTSCRDINAFSVSLDRLSLEPGVAAAVSSALFVADEMAWGLVPEEDGRSVVSVILEEVFGQDERTEDPVGSIALALAKTAERRIQ